MNNKANDITLNELQLRHNLSVRAFNICIEMKFNTLGDIQRYFDKNHDFKKIRNCGRRTSEELLWLTQNVSIDSFDLAIRTCVQKLSNRGRNAVFKYLNNSIINKQIIQEYFIDSDFSQNKIRNIGVRTETEIKRFANEIVDIFNSFQDNKLPQQEEPNQKLHRITGIKLNDPEMLELFQQNNFPIISFTAKYLKILFNLDNIEVLILKCYFNLNEEDLTLQDIAKRFLYSGERIRQKKEIVLMKIKSANFLSDLLPFSRYNQVFNNQNYISIPHHIQDPLILEEIKYTNPSYSAFILSIIYSSDYYLISSADKIKKPSKISYNDNYTLHKKINGMYLIRNAILTKERLLKTYEKLLSDICSIRRNGKLLDIRSFLGSETQSQGIEIASDIIYREFRLEVSHYNIFIPKSSGRLIHEFAIDALMKLGRPAHISEIIDSIKSIYPDFNSSEISLKATMGRHKNIFIFFGRSSMFGLKKWESLYKDIKGGTIRDIVEEFLRQEPKPCHINDIAQYVKRFRKTNIRSILTNLRVTGNDRFIFYKNSYVGLTAKNYFNTNSAQEKLKEISIDELLEDIFVK